MKTTTEFEQGAAAERRRQQLREAAKRELMSRGIPERKATMLAKSLSGIGLDDAGLGVFVTDARGGYGQSIGEWLSEFERADAAAVNDPAPARPASSPRTGREAEEYGRQAMRKALASARSTDHARELDESLRVLVGQHGHGPSPKALADVDAQILAAFKSGDL